MNSILENFANWVCHIELSQVPDRVQKKARYQILNVIASLFAAEHHKAAQAASRCIAQWNNPGPCVTFPTGEKHSLHSAVLMNAVNSMALDYDDYLYMGHTGHSSVLASLGLCELEEKTTEELLIAQIIGNEIGGRLGISTALSPQNGQAWSYIHSFAAAGIGARLLGLSVNETMNALAISLYQPGYTLWPGFMGGDSKLLTAAWPTVQGLQAAQLAKQGLTGACSILDHPTNGFWKHFTYVPLPHMMTGLGRSWLTDTLTFKQYPGCAYIDTTMDSLFELLSQYRQQHGTKIKINQIKFIDIKANFLTVEMDNLSWEYQTENTISSTNINFSIPYNVAIGILAGELTAKQMDDGFLKMNQGALRGLAEKVTLTHDWAMTLDVIDAVSKCLHNQSIAAVLTKKEWLELIFSLKSQLGGARRNGINIKGLIQESGRIFRIRREQKRNRHHANDLGDIDFSKFEMTFPAEVTLTMTDGTRLTSRKNIPIGAPNQTDYFSMVEEKFNREAGETPEHKKFMDCLTDHELFLKTPLMDLVNLLQLTDHS